MQKWETGVRRLSQVEATTCVAATARGLDFSGTLAVGRAAKIKKRPNVWGLMKEQTSTQTQRTPTAKKARHWLALQYRALVTTWNAGVAGILGDKTTLALLVAQIQE